MRTTTPDPGRPVEVRVTVRAGEYVLAMRDVVRLGRRSGGELRRRLGDA